MAKSMKTMDGNNAAAHVAYAFTEVTAIYPITPSSPMAEYCDEWAAHGRKNIFGDVVKVVEMQSEAGASGAMHGALQGGALTSTFTASQGLLLMIPNMYKMSGELLPGVFHVSARTIATQALSIFGDHSDVMAARQTGFGMIATGSVQEILDLAPVAHAVSIKSRVPFLHFFDGFRTSHEIQKVETLDYDDYAKLVDFKDVQDFRERALNPDNPVTRGTAQNPDIFFQAREASNKFYDVLPDMVADVMKDISKMTGRDYQPFTYYGDANAEDVIVAMGSVTDVIKSTIDYMNKNGRKVGLVSVHLYRPFSSKYFLNAIPKSVKRISVLDRTKEPGAEGEPLYLDVRNLYYEQDNTPLIVGGRYGLSSKDTTPEQIVAVYDNLIANEPKNGFTIGIVDDVTFLSLPLKEAVDVAPKGTHEAKFYGLGSDGTVGANKNSIKIIGDKTDMYAQGYFAYDSKKSGGITISHLRFGQQRIQLPYLVNSPSFVQCSVPAYLTQYDMLKGLKKGGTFLLNCPWSKDEVAAHLTDHVKNYMATNDINFYILDATQIAEDIGLGNRTNTIMQSAFFNLSGVIPFDDAVKFMKEAIKKSYGKKGDIIVEMNYKAVDAGADAPIKIDVSADWKSLPAGFVEISKENWSDFYKDVASVINRQKGDDLPVSAFVGREDGTFPAGTTKFEKRGVAVNVPEWVPESCIQCNQCAYVCPHAVIRPFLATETEQQAAPAGTNSLKAVGKGMDGLDFSIRVSVLDCTGCGNCADICPGRKNKETGEIEKALVMKHLDTQLEEQDKYTYFDEKVGYKTQYMGLNTVKGSQFAKPLFEFHGACAGCGETPYIKAITQLYGDRMVIANATGCSSIYGGSAPATPYCKNDAGQGPAWANSLFEDNAEYGMGINVAATHLREKLSGLMKQVVSNGASSDMKAAAQEWLDTKNDAEGSKLASAKIMDLVGKEKGDIYNNITDLKDYLVKRSQWIFGGDGWAYDIGYGGLDHVLASGEDVNVLVVDTEIYSNTGGQSSKATPTAAVAKFAAAGKRIRKKDLGMMAMSYGYVYVAQVAMGSNKNQFHKALQEAEAYPGPSLIIAYSPCISHGIKAGMGKTQEEEKKAVAAGYWHLYRYNPLLEDEGKNPFIMDSKDPSESFQDFIKGEVRYATLLKTFPDEAEELFQAAEKDAKHRLKTYKRLAAMDFNAE